MSFGKAYAGREFGPEEKEKLDLLYYDKGQNRLYSDAGIEIDPGELFLGNNFKMTNGVSAVTFRLGTGVDAIGIVNRYGLDGALSNPKFYHLRASQDLVVNTIMDTTLPDPLDVQYVTAGDNLTYDFKIVPATSGYLRFQIWAGTNDMGNKVFDQTRVVTQAEVDAGVPINFGVLSPYILPQGTSIFVRFSGIQLKGSATLPYFISTIFPYIEVHLINPSYYVTESFHLDLGCTYEVSTTNTTNGIHITMDTAFTDTFIVSDAEETFSPVRPCTIDFTAFGQGIVTLQSPKDYFKFYYDGSQWRFKNLSDRGGGIVGA